MVKISEASSFHSPKNDKKYDVFLSFRGEDTRLTFTSHLNKALEDANLKTFLDDKEIDTGLSLKPELESAIRASRASVMVLSKNYTTSRWCLNVLALILEQHRDIDHIVIPIFYHVEPTDVRNQQNNYEDAMEDYKKNMAEETNAEKKCEWAQKIEIWKNALTLVVDLKGKMRLASGFLKHKLSLRAETVFIEEIVKEIHHGLGVPLNTTLPLLIRMDYNIKFITSWLKDGSSHTGDILTILVMGMIGKTSLAKYVYGKYCHEFSRSSIVENIRRRCGENLNGLLDLQKQFCGDISKTSSIQGQDVISVIENALANNKVLLVLDDVDSFVKLDALLGNRGFYPGSKIIITTKDESLTHTYSPLNPEIQPKHTKHFLVGLDKSASLKLLSFHAFECAVPKNGYEEVSYDIVKYSEGHPLALEVLGRSLHNQDVAY
ncbi:disease resistance protein RML1A-like protein isoform X1 [Tanacetum coccineum]|uniref:Disease resistance protein RML1A-like protein isoform X1 n=1 Tax=Tanacetum coccineum TaxID=301880 RepID=A0ABQ5AW26_9ASTR